MEAAVRNFSADLPHEDLSPNTILAYITRSGRIVPDKEYRHKLIQRAHQRHVRECLAQAIFHKVLEMERLHQIEIKKKLEEFARRERVHKIKVERSRRYEEDIIRILSPRPPTGARGIRKQHSGPECNSESSDPDRLDPTQLQEDAEAVRLKPIHSNSTTASLRRSSPYRHHESSMRTTHLSTALHQQFVTPVPPATKRKERGAKVTQSSTLRGRRLRPTTATSGVDITEDPPMLRSSVHQSRVCVNMVYFGKTVHLSNDLTDLRDEVKVFQQHCGGENLCVYKGKLREGESFRFISRRHRGFPFSLTFFLNGLQVERLSSCCEFKHRKGSRLGGRHGHFGFSSVEGASPCYNNGSGQKPTPPPKRVREDRGREESVTSPKDAPEMEAERTGGDSVSEYERSQQQDMETQVEEETAAEEGKVRDDYEEDFEADDEGPAEQDKEKKSPSPTNEPDTQVKERDTSETEDDEGDEDVKSRSGSSCSGSNREASDAEVTKDSREDEKPEQPEEVDQEESLPPPEEKMNQNQKKQPLPLRLTKSVQERLAEAMLTESHFTSEPELSDTTTEEEEEATDKRHEQSNNDVAVVTVTEGQQTLREPETEAEVVQDLEETSEPREQEDETEKEPHESSTKEDG
ncbi:hypothetical protein INR49_019668 [Caranx melampygus]|nr:hypothetical protein INR49_019668 [Caranx melampygus]